MQLSKRLIWQKVGLQGVGGETENHKNRNNSCLSIFPRAEYMLKDEQLPPLWNRPALFLAVHF